MWKTRQLCEHNTVCSNEFDRLTNVVSITVSWWWSFLWVFFSRFRGFFTNGISSIRNSGCLPRGKPAATESRYPTHGACWVFHCFHNPPNSDMDYGIFNVRADVDACDCIRGCTDTVRESALKVDSGRKIPCRTEQSKLRLRRALHTRPPFIPCLHF